MSVLTVEDLSVGYERPYAIVEHVSFEIHSGSALGIVGRNGAGKSTLVNALAGQIAAWSGRVVADGRTLRGASCSQRVRAGVAVVPEGRQVFERLTVEENLKVAAFGAGKRLTRDTMRSIGQLFPVLDDRRHARAIGLSGGQQQMLAIARALVTQPRFLVMDEPSLGLAPVAVKEIGRSIGELVNTGTGVCVIEQNPALVEALCDTVLVLANGRVTEEMTREEFKHRNRTSVDYSKA